MSRAVDFHSHILAGIDDGSKSTEEAVAILEMELAQGIDCVVATPHFYPHLDHLDRFLECREISVAKLREKMKNMPTLPQVCIGAEVHYFKGIGDCEELPLLTINGGKYILIEMPAEKWTDEMYCQLERIYYKQNITPIIAHIDRYLKGFRSRKILRKLEEMPVLIQANAEFFLRKRTESAAMRMLRSGKIHLLGSDCHNLTTRPPNLGEALKKIEKRLGADGLEKIHQYEQKVLWG